VPHWLIKSAIHRAISWLPRSQFWNGLFQSYVTKSTKVTPQIFEEKLKQCSRFFEEFRRSQSDSKPFRVLEIGTGWIPTVPVGLYLCGASEIWSIDIDPLLTAARVESMLRFYESYHQSGKLRNFLPRYQEGRLEKVRALLLAIETTSSPSALLEQIQIHVMVGDAQKMLLPSGKIDFIFSNGVLEYIPPEVLKNILLECRRLSAAGAVMSHRLNLIDQFSYFDHSITPYNFLQYTSAQWKALNSPLIWQNRLRISDFRKLISESGFAIMSEDSEPGSTDDLKKIKLAPEFMHYNPVDLSILHSWITARRNPTERSDK
jgi:hypothetical protein